jgi:fatty acid synthase subunit alpha
VLKKWDQDNWASPEQRQKLAHLILVELLAYQFASPVRWIETQDLLFKDFAFERFIEIGPSLTLIGMATRTLKAKYEPRDDSITHPHVILCHAKNGKEIYYQFEDELVHVKAQPTSDVAPAISSAPVQTAAAPVMAPSGPAMSVDDVPIKANDVLNVIVAQKLKKKVEEVPLSKSIKDFVGMDLDYILPFAAIPENGHEIDSLDDKPELAHRIMLVNLHRILGAANNKTSYHVFPDELSPYY